MRFGFRATAVALLSLLAVVACVAGENQCLNPQPDLPSCRATTGSGQSGGASGLVTGSGGSNDGQSPNIPPPNSASGGTSAVSDSDAGSPAEPAAGSGVIEGAAGERGNSGAEAGAGGAAGSVDEP